MSHTYNLSHACLSHTHTVKHPTSVALLRATEWLDIETARLKTRCMVEL